MTKPTNWQKAAKKTLSLKRGIRNAHPTSSKLPFKPLDPSNPLDLTAEEKAAVKKFSKNIP